MAELEEDACMAEEEDAILAEEEEACMADELLCWRAADLLLLLWAAISAELDDED